MYCERSVITIHSVKRNFFSLNIKNDLNKLFFNIR